MRFEAIVFDLDDTLYAEMDFVRSGFHAVSEWVERCLGMEATAVFNEFVRIQASSTQPRTFDDWLANHGLSQTNYAQAMIDVYRSHQPHISLREGAVELLSRLSGRYRLGIVTDGYLNVQQNKICALGLHNHIEAIVCSDEFGRESWKPSHRPYLEVLNVLAVQPAKAMYIGDNPAKDFLGANQLGMVTVRYRADDGLHSTREPIDRAHAPTFEIDSLLRIEEILMSSSMYHGDD